MADDLKTGGPAREGEAERSVDHWFPARVLTAEERAQPKGQEAEELLALAKARAQDPSVFEEFPPHFFTAVASTGKLDSYSTRMHRSSLENFATDLDEGRSLLDSHNAWRLGVGYSLRGKFVAGSEQRAQADLFTSAATTDSAAFLAKLRSGMVRDVSAGFHSGEWICDLCGQEMRDWWSENGCRHWPGSTYEDKEGNRIKATATIHHARLAELSGVYDGATPGCMIVRANRMSEAGLLVPDMARALEVQYRIKLPVSHRAWTGTDTHGKEAAMPDEPGKTPRETDTPGDVGILQAFHRSIAAALAEVPLPPESRADEPATLIRRLGAELIELRPLRDKVATQETRLKELEPQAEDGKQFRADLRAAVEAEYVRARGASAKVELKAEVWDRASIALLKAEYEEYAGQAYQLLGGGRSSVDQGDPHPNGDGTHHFVIPAAPPSAFRA